MAAGAGAQAVPGQAVGAGGMSTPTVSPGAGRGEGAAGARVGWKNGSCLNQLLKPAPAWPSLSERKTGARPSP